MHAFTYDALPGRVVFGAKALDRLPEEVPRLGAEKALVLSTLRKGPADDVAARLGARAAREEARRLGADACVAVGGGSTIGLGKAIALELGLPILAAPTIYAGSEMTPFWGLTEPGVKRTGRDPKVLPRTVIYDPNLTLTMPAYIAGPSGINAIAHCVEALYAENANPITSLMA